VLGRRTETHDVVTLRLKMPARYEHEPGQFNMLSLPGIGEAPISVSGRDEDAIEHTIRAVGATTKALCGLREGDHLGLRGPYGSGWPLDEGAGRAVTVIAGGIGLAPLREALRRMEASAGRHEWVRLVYGARSPEDLLFRSELRKWREESRLRVSVTVDRGSPTWTGNIGAVTALLHRKELPRDGFYLMCGPEVMMRVVVRLLERAAVPRENVYLSMERNMKCGAGLCGRCQFGPYFVCKDGPVFRYDRVAFLFGRKGF
jgi:NAD(P)H-flavin reductase